MTTTFESRDNHWRALPSHAP